MLLTGLGAFFATCSFQLSHHLSDLNLIPYRLIPAVAELQVVAEETQVRQHYKARCRTVGLVSLGSARWELKADGCTGGESEGACAAQRRSGDHQARRKQVGATA